MSSNVIAAATGGFVGGTVTVVEVDVEDEVVGSSGAGSLFTYTTTTTSIPMMIKNISEMRRYFL